MIASYKTLVAFILISLFSFNASAQKDSVCLFAYFKGNGDGLHFAYSEDGFDWKALKEDSIFLKPAVGRDKLMRDPCIIRGADGKFHMVWTVSWSERGIGYASSEDLTHWSEQQYIPVMEHEPEAKNSWAPEITFDDKKKHYLIYWATTITDRFPQRDTSAEGQKNNHRMYATTTRDFKTFSKTTLFYEPGFSVIDATIVKNSDKEYIMFLKNETRSPVEKNIRLARAKKISDGFGKPSAPITGNYWAEGPTAVRIGNEWIVYFDKYTGHTYGAVASSDLKNWTDVSSKLKFPKGMRHGTVIKVSRGEFERMK